MFSCYLRLEHDTSTKKNGQERKTPRYVVTAQAGYFKPLEAIKNAKNEIVMYYQRNEKCNPNSKSETRLQCKGSVNLSSVYLDNLKIGETLIGSGEPPQSEYLKSKDGKKPNPFFSNRGDGFLFIISSDMKTIEILVVPDGSYLIKGYAKKLADGHLNEALNELRKSAKSE